MTTTIDMLPANRLVNLYLMSSYLYYEKEISPLEDSQYDHVCKCLLMKYDEITNHQHKCLIEKDALRAGTAFQIREARYPTVVKVAAFAWLDAGCPINTGRRRRIRNMVEEPAKFKRTRKRR